MFKSITLLPGRDKKGKTEPFESIQFVPGEMWAVVGNTGSGKSRLISDIEQFADGSGLTGRHILLNGEPVADEDVLKLPQTLISHLWQNMRFVLDATVEEFLVLRCRCRAKSHHVGQEVLRQANEITSEIIHTHDNLNGLSGGQTRALMIADLAVVCDSPIVLIDEIENAGIDKQKALQLLAQAGKLVLIITHDPHTALLCSKRLIMENGGISKVVHSGQAEKRAFQTLDHYQKLLRSAQMKLRRGELLCGL